MKKVDGSMKEVVMMKVVSGGGYGGSSHKCSPDGGSHKRGSHGAKP